MAAMIVSRRPDGRIAVDWTADGGPFITLTPEQWAALVKTARA